MSLYPFSVPGSGTRVRSRTDEAALRVRLLSGTWADDLLSAMQSHLGKMRTQAIGPIDTSRNALLRIVSRLAVSYSPAPLVSGMPDELASLIGDASGPAMIASYGQRGGRPMPSSLTGVLSRNQRYWLACNEAAVLVTWGQDRPLVRVATPDALEGLASPEDPEQPVLIRERRHRRIRSAWQIATDEWDLRDPGRPVYRVMLGSITDASGELVGGEDVTAEVLGEMQSGDAYPWRWSDGSPYLPWVIYHREPGAGCLWNPYAGIELSNGTLLVAVYWTYWGHVLKDCGFPRLWQRGCHLGATMTGEGDADGAVGTVSDPAAIISFEDDIPGTAGTVGSFPMADPEIVAKSILAYEQALEYTLIPVDYSGTGGDPLAQLQQAREATIRAYSTICRTYDSEVIRRIAAVANRALGTGYPEQGYGLAYRDEIQTLPALTPAIGLQAEPEPEQAPETASPSVME